MGILRFFETRSESVDPRHPKDPALAKMFGFGQMSSTGIAVSPESAIQESAVYSCVKVLSEDIAKLPLFVYHRGKDGSKRRASEHPLYDVLHVAPNQNQTSFEFRETGQANLLLRGNSISKIVSTNGCGVVALNPINPDNIKIFKDTKGRRAYDYRPERGKSEVLMQHEVLHIPGLSFDGLSGLNPIAAHRETIGLGLGLREFGARFFGSGANSSIAIKTEKNLNENQINNLKNSIHEKQSGLKNAHRPWVLEGGMEIEKLSINPADSQFLESRKYNRSDIAAIYRVPPHKIGDLERATFSNIEQQSIDYVTDSLMPWLCRWEQAMSRQLLSADDRKAGYFIQFEIKGLLRGDAVARSQYYRERFNIGSLSQNDIRKLEDEDPIKDGDKYFVPLNMRPHDTPMPAHETKGTRDGY